MTTMPPLCPRPRQVWQVGNAGRRVWCCVRSLVGFLSRCSLPNTSQHPGRSSTGKADLHVHRRQFVFLLPSVPNWLRCNQVTWRLWAQQHRWKEVWMRALLTFPQNPQWSWECILKAANLGQILWFLSGKSRNPRRLSCLLTLHGHLTVQRRHTQASCHNSRPCAIIFYKNTRVP